MTTTSVLKRDNETIICQYDNHLLSYVKWLVGTNCPISFITIVYISSIIRICISKVNK